MNREFAKCGLCGAVITDADMFPDICDNCVHEHTRSEERKARKQGKADSGCCDAYRDATIWPDDPPDKF